MSGNADNAPAAAEDAAPAPVSTATEMAAQIQQQLENLPEDQAKTVLPKDLIDPVNAALLGSPSDAPDVVPYTGQTLRAVETRHHQLHLDCWARMGVEVLPR